MTTTPDSFTPEQAKKMLCPIDATPNGHRQGMCCADDCMAWRWSQGKQTSQYAKDVIAHAVEARAKDPKHNLQHSYRDVLLKSGGKYERTEGYCGLAGYPHNSTKP